MTHVAMILERALHRICALADSRRLDQVVRYLGRISVGSTKMRMRTGVSPLRSNSDVPAGASIEQ